MAGNGGAGFVTAVAMLPSGFAFAPAGAATGAPPPDDVHVVVGAAIGAIATARPPMRWTTNISGESI
jgi:hypothetical protein